ncbi:prepilin-type N-terminal cleavage/methylation domain-containing protein, partial [bacterium]
MTNQGTRCKVQGAREEKFLTPYPLPLTTARGFTLIELIVATGLFALVMVLSSSTITSAKRPVATISSIKVNPRAVV